jgi:hypothetical protein
MKGDFTMFSLLTLRNSKSSVGVITAYAVFFLSESACSPLQVTVVNPADIAKAEGIQHPFQTNFSCVFSGYPNFCGNSFQTPASQRLVIEFISGDCDLDYGIGIYSVTVDTEVGGKLYGHVLSVQAPVSYGNRPKTISQPVRLYADPNTRIQIFVSLTGNNPIGWTCSFGVSGQAVDVPWFFAGS